MKAFVLLLILCFYNVLFASKSGTNIYKEKVPVDTNAYSHYIDAIDFIQNFIAAINSCNEEECVRWIENAVVSEELDEKQTYLKQMLNLISTLKLIPHQHKSNLDLMYRNDLNESEHINQLTILRFSCVYDERILNFNFKISKHNSNSIKTNQMFEYSIHTYAK